MTMRNELDFAGIDKLEEVGEPMAVGVSLDAYTGAAKMLTVPPGKAFIITHIVSQGDVNTYPFNASPNQTSTATGIEIVNAADTTGMSIAFMPFFRWQASFDEQDSPTWRNSIPSSAVVWKPRWPIAVPPTWIVRSQQAANLGNNFVVYGYLVADGAARTLGFDINGDATETNRRYGVESLVTTASQATLVAGRTGKSIQILDVFIRVQPETNVANVCVVEQTDGKDIFRIANHNPSDLVEVKCSPGIYLKSGVGIYVSSTVANTASVCISYRFVDEDEVPGDHWWSCTLPNFPTPATTQGGALDTFTNTSTAMVCYYPRLDTTKTSPTKGFQHLLRGYVINAQKDTDNVPEILMFRLSTGSTGGLIGNNAAVVGGITDSGYPLSPVFISGQHDQNLWIAVDGINLACKKDDGSIWVDAQGATQAFITTPSTQDMNVDQWAVTAWGRTIPSRWSDPTVRGAAS